MRAPIPPASVPRASTGIPGLDPLIEGGFPRHRAVLLRGRPGTGKTLFGLQFLVNGLASRERGALVSVDEKPDHVIADARAFGWDLQQAILAGDLAVLDASPYFTATRRRGWGPSGVDARQLSSDLIQQIRAVGAHRLVIDSLTSLVPMDMPPADVQNYLRSLIQSFEDNFGCTCLLTWRLSASRRPDAQGSGDAAEYLASGVIDLEIAPARPAIGLVKTGVSRVYDRRLVLRKMRGTALDPAAYPLTIDRSGGLLVAQPAESGTVREFAAVGSLCFRS